MGLYDDNEDQEPMVVDEGHDEAADLNEHGVDPATTDNVVNEGDATAVTDKNLEDVAKAREVLKAEAEHMENTSGPADNFSGDASEDPAHDHIFSNDPFKKAFPPGPDDPSKL